MSAEPIDLELERAVLYVSIQLHECTIDELRVIGRCIERLAVLRSATIDGVDNECRPTSALDEALWNDLYDVQSEREFSEEQHDADRAEFAHATRPVGAS